MMPRNDTCSKSYKYCTIWNILFGCPDLLCIDYEKLIICGIQRAVIMLV